MPVRIKICGCANAHDVQAVAALQPDAMGFIFCARSPRHVTAEAVRDWTADWPSAIAKVGVFVDSPLATIKAIVATARLDVVQLHGTESPAFCTALGGRVWKAIALNRLSPGARPDYPVGVEALLLDYQRGAQRGGTGCTLDWAQAAAMVRQVPQRVVLAGGLTPDNVQEAVTTVRPWGVDVSSGVEQVPGRKDMGKVKEFIDRCRANH